MRRDVQYLRDILLAGEEVGQFMAGVDSATFAHDRMRQLAVLSLLVNVGEAASRLSPETRARSPAIDWREAVAFRNFAVHAYFAVDWNPLVPIHAPQEGAFFRGPIPPGFLARQPGLPPELQYYDGKPPERMTSGTPWGDKGNFKAVTQTSEILPGFFVLTTRSEKPGTLEMNEVSLAIRTPKGLAVVVGCSHPGVEKILRGRRRSTRGSTP